jgi:hypothetical protein
MRKSVVTVSVEVQDLVKGMVATDGIRVFKILKVVPLQGYKTAQVITRGGAILNLPVDKKLKVRGYVKL